ncbi:MAG: nicotinate (nicotinamide) nucleotide adenylyltransferase [Firmicutes bacterium HGW-Firmicutes-11]|jgi:nicotinate-nucleotide adenylyltransferase|nr:MAG: nicotinate (nicotinamide) nucleotide adenylyltransferase [Firmicutes bacterium HGW-Firmicutes-11]
MKQIGIIGGSFDPIHNGHLILAEQARDGAGLDQVIFIPAKTSPFKVDQKPASGQERMKLVKLAIEDNPFFSASDYELNGPDVSYTITTLQEFKERWKGEAVIHFICGTDAFLSMKRWNRADEILKEFSLIVGARPRYKDKSRDLMIEELNVLYGTSVTKVQMPKIDISSSDIKERIRTGRSIRYLVPSKVEEWIREEGLYRSLV